MKPAALLAFLPLLLAACGGGGGDSGGSTTPPATERGSLTVGLAGSAAPGIAKAWVTVQALALHADASQPWSATDSSWVQLRLAQPVTVDLVALVNGSTQGLLVGQTLRAGSYGQMRLFLLGQDASLSSSAKAQGLDYNAQVEYQDAAGSTRRVPLELADVSLGLRLAGPFTVKANEDSNLLLQWDLERSLVRFAADDGVDRFTLRPELRSYDVSNSGAIVGLVDRSAFCDSGVRRDDCIYDAVASALLPDEQGLARRSVRSAPLLLGSDYARFGLYPLPALAEGQRYDVLIRGRNMRTLLIRQVPAPSAGLLGATPTWLGVAPANPSQPQPLVPVLQPQADAKALLATAMKPGSKRLLFTQTLPGDSLPLEISNANVDPFNGLLAAALPLPAGALQVASYSASEALKFETIAPQQGEGGYQLRALGSRYQDPGPAQPLQAVAGATLGLTAAEPAAKAALGSATLKVTIGAGSSGRFDAAQLIVSDAHGPVLTREVSALIGGGSVELVLPAGAAAAQLGAGAEYAVSLRAWKRSAPSSSLVWVRGASSVDLRSGAGGTLTLALP